MADTPGTVLIKDGNATLRPELVVVDTTLSNFAMQRVLRADGAVVDITNPLPTRVPAIHPTTSSGFESAHVLNVNPCSVGAIQVNNTSPAGWVMLFDLASVPPDGSGQLPVKAWQMNANATLDRSFTPPLMMMNGATLVFSTTGPFVKSASPTAMFSGETW